MDYLRLWKVILKIITVITVVKFAVDDGSDDGTWLFFINDRRISIDGPNVLLYAGAVGIAWAIMWFFLTYNSPATHPRISIEEREYIERALNTKAGDKVSKATFTLEFRFF